MKYFVRSLKYFCALCVLCIVLMGLMLMTGTSALSLDDTLYAMFHTDRYLMLFTAIVVLAALYPRFGFVERIPLVGIFAPQRGGRGDGLPRRHHPAETHATG